MRSQKEIRKRCPEKFEAICCSIPENCQDKRSKSSHTKNLFVDDSTTKDLADHVYYRLSWFDAQDCPPDQCGTRAGNIVKAV